MIYEDNEIRVIWSPGNSEFSLITFGDVITPAKDLRFFADKPLEKLRIAAIGVMAKRGNWYPSENIHKAAGAILTKISGYKSRLIYGGSMGGYAAIKFSRLFRATEVIALCPQWSIDPDECEGVYPGWRSYFTSTMRGMGIRANDVSGKIFVFSDPFEPRDMFHLMNPLIFAEAV